MYLWVRWLTFNYVFSYLCFLLFCRGLRSSMHAERFLSRSASPARQKNVPGYPAWDADILSTQYHSNWPTVHFACTCYTLLIDNGFGSRQRLLSRSGFQAALESPFSKPCRAAIPPSAALCIFMENLLLFLIGFSYVLNSNTFYRSCQSKFSSF